MEVDSGNGEFMMGAMVMSGSFENGVLHLTSWSANLMMATLAGLFFAAGVYTYSKGRPSQSWFYGGFAALMCSGLLRVLEKFASMRAYDDPDAYSIAILMIVNWVGNVLLPLYGVLQIIAAVTHYAGLLERTTIGQAWVRNMFTALMCFGLSGMLRLAEFFIQHTLGVPN